MLTLRLVALVSLALCAFAQHLHGESCACTRQHSTHPFDIDCSDASRLALNAAEATLTDPDGCGQLLVTGSGRQCSELVDGVQPCQMAFFALQAHHDHCEHGAISASHDELIHHFEGICDSCEIKRAHDPAVVAMCAPVDCHDIEPAVQAYHALHWTINCSEPHDRAAYALLSRYHDQCDDDDLPTNIERARHSFEALCNTAPKCNVVTAEYNATHCDENEAWHSGTHTMENLMPHSAPPPPTPRPPVWDEPWPLWADTLMGMVAWLIVLAVAALVLLFFVFKEVRALREIAARRGGASPIVTGYASMQDGSCTEMAPTSTPKHRPGPIV